MYGHDTIIKLLLERGADINAYSRGDSISRSLRNLMTTKRESHGGSALVEATVSGSITTVKLLLTNRANTEIRDRNGNTSLIFAVITESAEIIELLLSNGANIEATDNNGNTALMLAARHHLHNMVELLVAGNSRTWTKNRDGVTALNLYEAELIRRGSRIGNEVTATAELLRRQMELERGRRPSRVSTV
jgi:ankyrin repeat protein